MTRRRFAVLGLGNRLQGDEALGALVVEQLEETLPADLVDLVEIIDGGTVGLGLLPYIDDLDGLIVVDAVDHDAPPGTLIDIGADPLRPDANALSVHALGAAELIGALRLAQRLPQHLRIMGLQPESISLGTELSPAVAAAVPGLLDQVIDRLRDWTATARSSTGAGSDGER